MPAAQMVNLARLFMVCPPPGFRRSEDVFGPESTAVVPKATTPSEHCSILLLVCNNVMLFFLRFIVHTCLQRTQQTEQTTEV